MSSCFLNQEWLGHPCDSAFGVLMSPIAGTTLYLKFGLTSSDKLDASDWSYTLHIARTEHPRDSPAAPDHISILQDAEITLAAGDSSIDRVVFSFRMPYRRWRQVFIALIREIRRVLTPTGQLLITLEPGLRNAASKHGLLSHIWRYPRMFFRAVLPIDRHSIASALRLNGFSHYEWFVPWRDRGGCLISLQSLTAEWLPEDNWKQRIKMKAARNTVVRTSASPLQPALLQACALEASADITPASKSPKVAPIHALLVTAKEKVVAIVKINGTHVVMRIPFSDRALKACRQNMHALRNLQANPDSARLAPQPLYEGNLHGHYFSTESFIEGTPLLDLPRAQRQLEQVESVIKALNPSCQMTQCKLESSTLEKFVAVPLAAILEHVARNEDRATLQQYFSAKMTGMSYAAGISHGDLSLRNIFAQTTQISGVIDWDEGAMCGIPVLDAISHVCSRASHRGYRFSDTFCHLALRRWPEPSELAFLDRCYAYFNVEPGQHFDLVMLYWLQVVGSQSQFWFSKKNEFRRTRLDDIVLLLARHSNRT